MAGCSPDYGCVEPGLSRSFVAPCGTLEYQNGKPVLTATTLADFDSPEMSNFNYRTVTTVSKKKKINSCGRQRCRVRKDDYNGDFNLCVDPSNPTVCRMIAQSTNESACEFEWIHFPYPVDCEAPNILTDAVVVGSGVITDAPWSEEADAEDCIEIPITWEGCNRAMCRFNFCDQLEDGTEPPEGGGLTVDQQIQTRQIAEQTVADCITDAAAIKDAA